MLASAVADLSFLYGALPRPATQKLIALVAAQNALTAAANEIHQALAYARGRLREANARFAELEKLPERHPVFSRTPTGFQYLPPGSERDAEIANDRRRILAGAESERQHSETEVQRLEAEAATIRAKTSPLPSRILGWVRALPPGSRLIVHPPVKTPTGDPRATVQKLRQRLSELESEREAIASAPYPSAVAKVVARQWVDALADAGRVDVRTTLAHGSPPILALDRLIDGANIPTPSRYRDGAALVAWLYRDDLIDRLCAEIDEHADDKIALTAEQRKTRQAELDDERLSVERIEEMVISSSGDSGIEILRRDTANPLAVLGIAMAA